MLCDERLVARCHSELQLTLRSKTYRVAIRHRDVFQLHHRTVNHDCPTAHCVRRVAGCQVKSPQREVAAHLKDSASRLAVNRRVGVAIL